MSNTHPSLLAAACSRPLVVAITGLLFSLIPYTDTLGGSNAPGLPLIAPPPDAAQLKVVAQHLPLAFTANRGQWDDHARFCARTNGVTIWFAPDGVYHQFLRRIPKLEPSPSAENRFSEKPSPFLGESGVRGTPDSIEQLVVKTVFVDANPDARIEGDGLMDYRCNYFLGNDPAGWHTDVPNYSAVVYKDLYPGIDVRYYGNGTHLEYDLLVAPGADPNQIRIRYEGAEAFYVDANGNLVIETDWGPIIQRSPLVYQEGPGGAPPAVRRLPAGERGGLRFCPGFRLQPGVGAGHRPGARVQYLLGRNIQ